MELGIKVNARDKEKTKYDIRKKLKLAESFQKKTASLRNHFRKSCEHSKTKIF